MNNMKKEKKTTENQKPRKQIAHYTVETREYKHLIIQSVVSSNWVEKCQTEDGN